MARISPEDIHKARLISLGQARIPTTSQRIGSFSSSVSRIISNHKSLIEVLSFMGSVRKQAMFLVVPILFSATPSSFGVSWKVWFSEAQASIAPIPSEK